jgi:hypothetical protein
LSCMTIEPGSELTSIGQSGFSYCRALQFIDIPPTLKQLHSRAFCECGLSVLRLKSFRSLSRIQEEACMSNPGLRCVFIPASVRQIDRFAFHNCCSLCEVNFELPSNLVSIGYEAFAFCYSLTRFQIPASVTEIDGNFLCGSGVHDLQVDADNAHFQTIDGFLVNREGTEILCYVGENCDLRIGASIEKVGKDAFSGCQFLRSVTFERGSKVKVIESNAFDSCSALEWVRFGGFCPRLESRCFAECVRLRQILRSSRWDRLAAKPDTFS